jgi:hypothetical protein
MAAAVVRTQTRPTIVSAEAFLAKAGTIFAAYPVVVAVTRTRFTAARRSRETLIADALSFKAHTVTTAVMSTPFHTAVAAVPARGTAALAKWLLALTVTAAQVRT